MTECTNRFGRNRATPHVGATQAEKIADAFKRGVVKPVAMHDRPNTLNPGPWAVMRIEGDSEHVSFWRGSADKPWATPRNCEWFRSEDAAEETRDALIAGGIQCTVIDLPRAGWWQF